MSRLADASCKTPHFDGTRHHHQQKGGPCTALSVGKASGSKNQLTPRLHPSQNLTSPKCTSFETNTPPEKVRAPTLDAVTRGDTQLRAPSCGGCIDRSTRPSDIQHTPPFLLIPPSDIAIVGKATEILPRSTLQDQSICTMAQTTWSQAALASGAAVAVGITGWPGWPILRGKLSDGARIFGPSDNAVSHSEVTAPNSGFRLVCMRRRGTTNCTRVSDSQTYTYSSTSSPVEESPEAVV